MRRESFDKTDLFIWRVNFNKCDQIRLFLKWERDISDFFLNFILTVYGDNNQNVFVSQTKGVSLNAGMLHLQGEIKQVNLIIQSRNKSIWKNKK